MELIHYLINQFLNATVNSCKLMHTVITDHYAKLTGLDADVTLMRTRTLPVRDGLRNSISDYISASAARQGATQAFTNSVSDLSANKIRKWDVAIQNIYVEGSPEYIALLPDHRTPFQSGTYEERLSEVHGLGNRLTGIVPLAATKIEVDAFYTAMSGLRDTQTAKEGALSAAEDVMENARSAAAWMCYRNLGLMMNKWWDQLITVDNYFEFHLIQNVASATEPGESFIDVVLANLTANVAERPFDNISIITLKNTGTVSLRFFLSDTANGTAGATFIDVAAGAETTIDNISLLGNTAFTFLNVTNADLTTDGSYEVIVIEV